VRQEIAQVPDMTAHYDDFTLLRYVAGDLAEDEKGSATSHVTTCTQCNSALAELTELDGELRRLATAGMLQDEDAELRPDDPFRRRPQLRRAAKRHPHDPSVIAAAVSASERALILAREISAAVRRSDDLDDFLAAWFLADTEQRFALLYALQEAGRQIAENPLRALEFAHSAIRRLRTEAPSGSAVPAERVVPRLVLWAQAHVLAALACMWTKEFGEARSHLIIAYRSFARGGGDETGLAIVELTEAQRRGFVHEGRTALSLARRARATFEARGLEDLAARALVAEAHGFLDLDQYEEALRVCRQALPVFERYEIWSNYVGGLNSIATFLVKLGRLDEARQEYARALRRFSRETHGFWLGYLRIGLAETLFAAGRYREAALFAARAAEVFRSFALSATALTASLLEVESWARHGNLDRARHRLELFQQEIRDQVLDPAVTRDIADALSGSNPDFERLASLRQAVQEILQHAKRA
jgi:tetratricopeptide (TPR) repeat protein